MPWNHKRQHTEKLRLQIGNHGKKCLQVKMLMIAINSVHPCRIQDFFFLSESNPWFHFLHGSIYFLPYYWQICHIVSFGWNNMSCLITDKGILKNIEGGNCISKITHIHSSATQHSLWSVCPVPWNAVWLVRKLGKVPVPKELTCSQRKIDLEELYP